jgi:hypothetical protein
MMLNYKEELGKYSELIYSWEGSGYFEWIFQ